MKVKKEAYLRSLTALLRAQNLKNFLDPNEECEVWYTTVPSVTYLWTRKPQWRRRHKNCKKFRAITTTIDNYFGANADDFWSTSEYQERTFLGGSNSPYQSCSSRQIITESEFTRNFDGPRNRVAYGLTLNRKNYFSRRGDSDCGIDSDSGVQHSGGTKLTRSQKQGSKNSINSPKTSGTLSSLEVKRSVFKELQLDSSLPTRCVTFNNYVSEDSLTDTRGRISAIIMSDNDPSGDSSLRRSSIRFSDDEEDNCSMQSDLSCLISSINFDESKSSLSSLPAEGLKVDTSSDMVPDCKTAVKEETGEESFFYVNPAYTTASSWNLLSPTKNFSSHDLRERNGSSYIKKNGDNNDNFEQKTLGKMPSRSKVSKEIIPVLKANEDITTQAMNYNIPPSLHFMQNKCTENRNQSYKIIPDIKIAEKIKTETTRNPPPRIFNIAKKNMKENSSRTNKLISNIETPAEMQIEPACNKQNEMRENLRKLNKIVYDTAAEKTDTDPPYGDMEYLTIRLKSISSDLKEVSIESRAESDRTRLSTSVTKMQVSTDTGDPILLNIPPSPDPMNKLTKNDLINEKLNVDEILSFFQGPITPNDIPIILKKFTNARKGLLENCGAINQMSDRKLKEIRNVELLRIDTETSGEHESVLIEMRDLDKDSRNNETLGKIKSMKIQKCQEFSRALKSSHVSELVESSTSNFSNKHEKCIVEDKCCLICGRSRIDNQRYIRPVCRVKGGISSPLENDPWINVMRRMANHERHQKLILENLKNKENEKTWKHEKLTEESFKKAVSNIDEKAAEKMAKKNEKDEKSLENEEEEIKKGLSATTAREVEEPQSSFPRVLPNIRSSRADQSTSCCPPNFGTSTSFGSATFRSPRTRSANAYFTRDFLRANEGTVNRLLCVVSESDSLMSVPPFLPKKPPSWFARRGPTKRLSRR